jgi:hypothetical protein
MDENKPQYRSVRTKLDEILKETWRLYIKNFLSFCGLLVIPVILGVAIQIGILGTIVVNMIVNHQNTGTLNISFIVGGVIVAIILQWLIQMFGISSTLRGAYYADTQEKLPFGKALQEGFAKIGKAAGLSIRVFFYTGAWVLAGLGILFGLGLLAAFFASSNAENGFVSVMHPLTSFIGFIPLVIILLAILFIRRICRTAFAFPILLSKDVSSKEALDESIHLADGIIGIIFGNYFLFGMLMAIGGGILGQIFSQVFGLIFKLRQSGSLEEVTRHFLNISMYVSIIPSILVKSFSVVFQYAFMKKAREEKSEQGGLPQNTPADQKPLHSQTDSAIIQ